METKVNWGNVGGLAHGRDLTNLVGLINAETGGGLTEIGKDEAQILESISNRIPPTPMKRFGPKQPDPQPTLL